MIESKVIFEFENCKYVAYKNGKIIKELKYIDPYRKDAKKELIKIGYGTQKGKILINETCVYYRPERLIYTAFSGKKLNQFDLVKFKDGNSDNLAFDNLYLGSTRDTTQKNPKYKVIYKDGTIKEYRTLKAVSNAFFVRADELSGIFNPNEIKHGNAILSQVKAIYKLSKKTGKYDVFYSINRFTLDNGKTGYIKQFFIYDKDTETEEEE